MLQPCTPFAKTPIGSPQLTPKRHHTPVDDSHPISESSSPLLSEETFEALKDSKFHTYQHDREHSDRRQFANREKRKRQETDEHREEEAHQYKHAREKGHMDRLKSNIKAVDPLNVLHKVSHGQQLTVTLVDI